MRVFCFLLLSRFLLNLVLRWVYVALLLSLPLVSFFKFVLLFSEGFLSLLFLFLGLLFFPSPHVGTSVVVPITLSWGWSIVRVTLVFRTFRTGFYTFGISTITFLVAVTTVTFLVA